MPLGELIPVLRAAPSAGTGVLLTCWAVQAQSNFWEGSVLVAIKVVLMAEERGGGVFTHSVGW